MSDSNISPEQQQRQQQLAETLIGQPQPANTPATPPATGTATVTVACKINNGVILRLFSWEEVREPAPQGYVTSKVAKEISRITLRGPSASLTLPGQQPHGIYPSLYNSGSYYLNPGISREWWEKWCHDNADNPLLTKRFVFAADSPDRAADQGKEQVSVPLSHAPIDVSSDAAIRQRTGRDSRLKIETFASDGAGQPRPANPPPSR